MFTFSHLGSLEVFALRHLKAALPVFAAAGLSVFFPACALDFGAGTTAPEWESDTTFVDTETTDTGNLPADAGDAPQLTDAHTGLRQTACFDCHGESSAYPHEDEDLSAPDCGVCHGYNGAVHTDHASLANPGCDACHNSQNVPHFDDFAFPDDCVQCHNHPNSPEGL